MLRRLLHGIGYLIAPVLFLGASSPAAVARRLRFAYRVVGVDIEETGQVDGVERTIFRCPYRSIRADRYGEKWLCHDVLDRVDDGYVSYLNRHKNIDYQRPRGCETVAFCDDAECCYSEVSDGA